MLEIIRPYWHNPPTLREILVQNHLLLVITPNFAYYRHWCYKHGVGCFGATNVKVVTHRNDVRGYAGCWYVWLGTTDPQLKEYYENMVLDNLYQMRELKNV